MMQVAANTIVSIRYKMKNGRGEVLENNTEGEPVHYLHGAGMILPLLESELTGLKAGDERLIVLSQEKMDSQLDDSFSFDIIIDVIIDEVRLATAEELKKGMPISTEEAESSGCDTSGCCC